MLKGSASTVISQESAIANARRNIGLNMLFKIISITMTKNINYKYQKNKTEEVPVVVYVDTTKKYSGSGGKRGDGVSDWHFYFYMLGSQYICFTADKLLNIVTSILSGREAKTRGVKRH